MDAQWISLFSDAQERPELFAGGTTERLWTDPHITQNMLQAHLSPGNDIASYRHSFIDNAVDWMHSHFLSGSDTAPREKAGAGASYGPIAGARAGADAAGCTDTAPQNTTGTGPAYLDLGCGPGLYTSRMAVKGVSVTGVDFSENSLAYARGQAAEQGHNIEYIRRNYLELDLDRRFDLITIIYYDICVLSPDQLKQFLANVRKHLKPEGVFFFDVMTDKRFLQFEEKQIWHYADNGGFYSPNPYLLFENHLKYEKPDVTCEKIAAVEEDGTIKELVIWHSYYTLNEITDILQDAGLRITETFGGIAGGKLEKDSDVMAIAAVSA